ncbi:MAG: DUF853 family protein, partial [Chloroflexi bacterium]|nr:DUF853 family protein [Chloroflexota bacterium]
MTAAPGTRRTTGFNRAPRSFVAYPRATVKVPDPPPLPASPQKPHILMLLLPALTMGATATGTVIIGLTSGNKFWWLALLMLSGAVLTPVIQNAVFRSNKKAWEKRVEEIEQAYQNELSDMRARLSGLYTQQLQAAEELDPPVALLCERAAQRHRRLWERRPHDEDFLHLRIGTYAGAPMYELVLLESEQRDPRKKQANDVARPFATISDLPCVASLPDCRSIGIAGEPGFRSGLARTILCNLAVHPWPGEVRLFAVYATRGGQASVGNWLKWLPHSQPPAPDQLQGASTPEAINRLMTQLLEELKRREHLLRNRERPASEYWPYLVILVEDLSLVRGQEAINLVLQGGPELRAGAIFLADDPQQIPGGCGALLEADPQLQNGFVLTPARPDQPAIHGIAELTSDPKEYDTLARSLAPIEFSVQRGGELPNGITLSALFNAPSARDLNLRQVWAEHADHTRQLTAPLGMAIGNRLLELDLHITAHGTHGLIAGTTGAGKTVLLSTVIAALAVANSPRLVNFVIIDMKGDKSLELLSRLPHTVGFASVLDKALTAERLQSYIQRAIVALRSEIDRRMQKLSQAGTNEIFQYNRRNPRTPLPHLMVIIDEFAVLKKQAPDLMDALVDVAALGRAPGVHLILCTQSPGGVVSDKIWANSQFRICLRVANSDESRSVLHLPDAASLPVKPQGRAYLQASGGDVEIFELFQVAYAGKRLSSTGAQISSDERFEIAEIWPDGTRQVLYTHSPAVKAEPEEGSQPTELEYIIDLARQTAIEDGLSLPLPGPWLPPLPETIPLEPLIASYPAFRRWNGQGWDTADDLARLRVPLGMLDEPAQQRQDPLLVDLAHDHTHLWACGTLNSGKLLALRTLVMALASTHTPDDLHFYFLAFGGTGLAPLARLPHVGGMLGLSETDRLQRVMTMVEQEIVARQKLLSAGGVDSIDACRRATGQPVPTWVIVVEDLGKLTKEALMIPEAQDVLDRMMKALSSGLTCDIHFVFSTTGPGLYRDMGGSINGRLALRLQDKSEYSAVLNVRPAGALDEILGRGFWRSGNEAPECQIATPADTPDDQRQAALLSV